MSEYDDGADDGVDYNDYFLFGVDDYDDNPSFYSKDFVFTLCM